MKAYIKILISIVFISSAHFALAATYWVSPTGSASWASCTGSTPLNGTSACPLSTANSDAMPGDTVYLRGGDYSSGQAIEPTNSGVSTSSITFSAYNNEDVEFISEFIPNRYMATSSWASYDGATVSLSNAETWAGLSYSTEFTATTSGQGIQSGNFTLPAPYDNAGFDLYACVYSSATSTQVTIYGGGGSQMYNQNVPIYSNYWTCFNTKYMSSGGQSGPSAHVLFTSPTTTPAGTWYVSDVRMHVYGSLIYLNDKSYINISGINVSDADQGFDFENGSSYNQISSSTFTNIDDYSTNVITGPNSPTPEPPSSYNWVHGNTFHDNGYVDWSGSGCFENGDMMRIGESSIDDYSVGNLIEDNVFYHTSHDDILLATPNNTVRDNVFHNEDWFPNAYISTSTNTACNGALSDPPDDLGARNVLLQEPEDGSVAGYNLIENNRVGFAGTPYTQGANDIENATNGNIIRFNYLYKADSSGLEFKEPSTGTSTLDPSYNLIYNNTFYDNGGGQAILTVHQGDIQLNWYPAGGGIPPQDNVIMNNILYGSVKTFSGTLSLSNFMATNTVENNFESNPGFTNPDISNPYSLTLPDLSVGPTSGVINQAYPLTTVAASDTESGTSLIVNNASFFQDGSWCPPGHCQADWIAVGSSTSQQDVQISSINYDTNTLTLDNSISRTNGAPVYLYKDSDGTQVMYGTAPDDGAYQYPSSITGSFWNLVGQFKLSGNYTIQ